MDSKAMHYDFKQKLNKIDSQQYRNFRVPEIDWKLNEAMEIFIKSIAEPRVNNHLGFEVNQRTIDDIRTIVVNDKALSFKNTSNQGKEFIYSLPTDYLFYVSASATISREGCPDREAVCILRQHDDLHEQSSFDKSSFEWKTVNFRFFGEGIKVFTDGTFEIKDFRINYIREPKYIHNAQDFLPSQTYKMPNGVLLSGTQDCELPKHTHREIVDIAVLIVTGDLQIPDYQIKQAKLNLNQIN